MGKEKEMLQAIKLSTGLLILSILSPNSNAKMIALSNICPTVEVKCISGDCCDSPFEFKVLVNNIRPTDKPVYKWSVSNGKIISGQGTAAIKVDSTGFEGHFVNASVEIDGIEANCALTASASQTICDSLPPSRYFDQYGNISFINEKSHLDRFAAQLQNDHLAKGYLIIYNNNLKRAKRAKNYLVKKYKINTDRIVIIEGGKNNSSAIELYVVPYGGELPTANPTVTPNNSFNRNRA
jgi:hypothetical protein